MTSFPPPRSDPTPRTEAEALEMLYQAHREFAGRAAEVVIGAPGRVNMIGEHTDYHGGFVLPAAISLGTYVAASRRADDRRRLRSLAEVIDLEIAGPFPEDSATVPRWALYPLGVIEELEAEAPFASGFDLTYVSTLPKGIGLASSASVEVGTGLAICELFGRTIDRRQLAGLVQRAETKASGVRVGIMDPLAIAIGEAGNALFIDCANLTSRPVPLPLDDFAVVVCDSGRSRGLATSSYNKRRDESQRALDALDAATGIAFTGRVLTPEIFSAAAGKIADPMHRRRLSHLVSENERVKRCVAALETRDMGQVRDLFLQSHRSLRFDYEVSTPELDALVELAREAHPLVAARLTGAGFGGATVNLVPRAALRFFMREVPSRMAERFPDGAPRPVFEVEIAGAARRIA